MRHGTLNTGNPQRGVTRAGAEAMLRATDALATQENWLQSGEQAMRQIARDLGFGVLQDDGDRSNVYERQNASFYRRSAWADVEPLYVRLPGDKTRWAVGAKAVALPSRQPVLWLGWHAEAWQYRTAARLARARAQAQAVLDWLERDGWEHLTILAGDLNTDVDGKSLRPLYAAGFTNAHRRLGRTPTFGRRVVLDHILWRDPERVLTPRRLSTVRTGSDHRGLVLTYDLKPARKPTTPPPKPPPVVVQPPTPEPETPKPPEEEPVTYRYLTDLADVLTKAGLDVEEVSGWKTRGRPKSTGGFNPVGVLWHHTGSYDSLTDARDDTEYAAWLAKSGRSDLPAPLCQISISAEGKVYICAAGRANHAGKAKASGSVAGGDGNSLYIGIECMNSGKQGWPKPQYEAMVATGAALAAYLGTSPKAQRAHKETSVTGKWDPGMLDMDKFRRDIAARIEANKPPAPQPEPEGPVTTNPSTRVGQARLLLDEARKRTSGQRADRITRALSILPKE